MPGNKNELGEYSVGYAKPPQEHQFKPGVSGNPKGKRKNCPTISTLLKKRLSQKTKVKVGSRVEDITFLDAGILRLVHTLIKGPPEKAIAVLKFALPIIQDEARNNKITFSDMSIDEIEARIYDYNLAKYGEEIANMLQRIDENGRQDR